MLVVRSPCHRARFSLGDLDSFIRTHPGVVAVYTAADIPGSNRFGVIPQFADQPALAEAETRFRGEAIAVIAAEPATLRTLDTADFPVEWTELPPLLEPGAAEADGAPRIHAGRERNLLTRGRVERGDPDAALAGAAMTVSGGIETSHVEHAYIEPEAGHAVMDGDTLVVTACTQAPYMDRDDTARVLGLAPALVMIVQTAKGGGFVS